MHGVKAGKWHGKISLSPHPSIVGVFTALAIDASPTIKSLMMR